MHDLKVIIILALSAALLLLIVVLLVASILRRIHHQRKYRLLDGLRSFYERKLTADLIAGGADFAFEEYRTLPGSLEWQAVEDSLFLLMDEERYHGEAKRLFPGLGYVAFYEERLASGNKLPCSTIRTPGSLPSPCGRSAGSGRGKDSGQSWKSCPPFWNAPSLPGRR
jgi:hypothetical protein